MRFWKILTPLRPLGVALCCVALHAPAALAQPAAPPSQAAPSDSVILDMREAARRGDKARLAALLPAARGHALEPWAAYWELKARLEEASAPELQDFLTRYAGTYQEDRLRNDWLLLSGKRRDWTSFAEHHPAFRMRDDREVRCYAVAADLAQGRAVAREAVEQVRADWFAQRDIDDGCLLAAGLLHQAGKLPYQDLWKKARLAVEANRPTLARAAVELDAPDVAADVAQIQNSAVRYLATRAPVVTRKRQELVTLALIKLASGDPDQAAAQMDGKWAAQLTDEERNWVWAVIAKQATLKLQDGAAAHLAKITRERDLSDDLLTWATRAALRQGDWARVRRSIDAMSEGARRDPTWTYWLARAQLVQARGDTDRAAARQLLEGIAGVEGFYEKLALEELGRPIVTPPAPAPLTAEERDWARRHPGLNRGLQAIALGLRSEGVREWNYWTNLHVPGGMGDRELLAAARLACDRQDWQLCINTADRTKVEIDTSLRYPTPFADDIHQAAGAAGLDPALVFGLIRQETRFMPQLRSHVGASGLMQVMPATARWVAKKIGMDWRNPAMINDPVTNLKLGTAYLKLVLDALGGSQPMAAAAYNAGPGRPRRWREGPVLEAAIWAENIPFNETRDYVKKVLSNAAIYGALLDHRKPPALRPRLGTGIGPRDAGAKSPDTELP